jgi:polyhydroxybutyrate depolymerase
MSVSCGTSSSKAVLGDASSDGFPGKKTPDGGSDARPRPTDAKPKPVDATAGCGLCGRDAVGHPGTDAGITPKGPTHTTGVSIAVTTATGVQTRTYDITLPTDCDAANPLPLVFAFHGDGGSGAGMYASFPIEQAAAAAGGKAIFVYPDGTDDNLDPAGVRRAWDLYHDPGPFPYAVRDPVPAVSDEASGNVDVDFFDAMVAKFEASYCVDSSRIFITGMSSGGFLSNQFARWRSGVVKGTAPQSGGAPFGNGDATSTTGQSDWSPPNYCVGPTGAVPALIIHGAADTTVYPCNGIEAESYWGVTNGCAASANNCTTTSDSSAYGGTCTGTNLAVPPPAPTTPFGTSGDCVQASGCSAPVIFCEAPQTIWGFFASL